MPESAYDKREVKRIDELPPEKQTEDLQVIFDIPHNATFGPYPITEVGYSPFGLFVIYDDDTAIDGRDQLRFGVEVTDGEIAVTERPVGLCTPAVASESSSPGANEAEDLYGFLESLGIGIDIGA